MSSQAIPLNAPSNDSALPAQEPKLDPSPYEASNQFAWRASLVGSFLGCFVGASNLYLGLKVGWVFSAGIFGAAFTFILLKLAIRVIPKVCPHFSVQENCIAQTAATTSGGLNVGFITCIPAIVSTESPV
ncbi:hypothetical protein DSO57_1029327 [Entomophthora muscae]|uniref:Uncharacterized protein n=1 Tax=Entomophthora muscae TaxID=34485 RepID=A0ACC2SE52_9FUNG|nr:hypothetical protein DSO57_1029327 [Entomophthora muscae]